MTLAIEEVIFSQLRGAITREVLREVLTAKYDMTKLSLEQLLDCIEYANYCYRSGNSVINDDIYDFEWLPQLKKLDPNNAFLHKPEPEPLSSDKRVLLPKKMLSTEKAYSKKDITQWLQRIEKEAEKLQIQQFEIRLTPKLDGFAAFDDGNKLYTRGDGIYGRDISFVLARGLHVLGERGLGPGEIVTDKQYFKKHLADSFANTRQVQGAILARKNPKDLAFQCLKAKATQFVPFAKLPEICIAKNRLLAEFEDLVAKATTSVPYDIDGVVIEVSDNALKKAMGATLHHHRWQIAFKSNQDSAVVSVISINPQTSRTGRVNPVIKIAPTPLSGVIISNVTAYHYNYVKTQNIGPGTKFELVRSGLVIPKIERLISTTTAQVPTHCPSCKTVLQWSDDYLVCNNHQNCADQQIKSISYFFEKLGNIDGLGEKTIALLYHYGKIKDIPSIYQLTQSQWSAIFQKKRESEYKSAKLSREEIEKKEKNSNRGKAVENLMTELQHSRLRQLYDWCLLSAFGIDGMAEGNCERLLSHYNIEDIFHLTTQQVAAIDGFAELSAQKCVQQIQDNYSLFQNILAIDFNLITTPKNHRQGILSGQRIVFTGTMPMSRSAIEQLAKAQGAVVLKTISSQTTLLVTGEKVGISKMQKAEKLQIKTQDVSHFLQQIPH